MWTKIKIQRVPVCPVNDDSFSEVDFTKLQSATVVLREKEYELTEFLHDIHELAVRENDYIAITCQTGNLVLSEISPDNYYY